MAIVITGAICFGLGAIFGLFLTALLVGSSQGDERVRELRYEMCRQVDQYLEAFKSENGSAHDQAIANEVSVVAKNIIKTTVD